jgi:hypothetical protein
MSINTMANAAAARRPDIAPANIVPSGLDEIAKASTTTPTSTSTTPIDQTQAASASAIDTASHVLFGYVPTEVVTLYVAVLAAIQNPKDVTAGVTPSAVWITFVGFLIATPIVVWLVYGAKLLAVNKSIPLEYSKWPVWEMFAATVAFCAWAFALPNSPFSEYNTSWYSSALAGVVVLVASTVLGLLAPFFQHPLGGDNGGGGGNGGGGDNGGGADKTLPVVNDTSPDGKET